MGWKDDSMESQDGSIGLVLLKFLIEMFLGEVWLLDKNGKYVRDKTIQFDGTLRIWVRDSKLNQENPIVTASPVDLIGLMIFEIFI